jgi:hypothetical protein
MTLIAMARPGFLFRSKKGMTMTVLFLWAPFSLCLLVGVVTDIILREDLNEQRGVPTGDFSRSWASNISVVGGLVTFSTMSFLPSTVETKILTRSAYAVLLFAFPLLAALAPLIYNFSRRVQKDTSTPPAVIAQGKAYMFIVASILTIWSAVGQLALQTSLIEEVRRLGYLPSSFALLIELLLSIIGLGVLQYGGRTVIETVRTQVSSAQAPAKSDVRSLGETHIKRWALL